MKKKGTILISLLVFIMLFAFAACSSPQTGSAYSITLNRTEADLVEGGGLLLTAKVEEDGTEIEADVKWKSSDPNIATVENGNVNALAVGTVTITAEYAGANSACIITVTKYYEPQLRIALNYSEIHFSAIGQTDILVAEATVGGESASDINVRFSSSDTKVAAVSEQGEVTSVSVGEAYITAYAESGGYYAESVCTVTVEPFSENIIVESDESYYIYYWEPDRNQTVAFDGQVVSVTDVESGQDLPYEVSDGKVNIKSGVEFGEHRVSIKGKSKELIVTGIFVSGEIATPEDLVSEVRNNGQYLMLVQDIDMSEYLEKNPWNSKTEAFFNVEFSGTLDGQGYSILNLEHDTGGPIDLETATVFRQITASGTLKNLHLQIALGANGNHGGAKSGLLIQQMYGTLENCFFEVDATFDDGWGMYGSGPFQTLAATTKVVNTVFYVPAAADLRMMCAESSSHTSHLGIFQNVTYVFGGANYRGLLPAGIVNPNISGIHLIIASGNEFIKPQSLAEEYAAGATANDVSLWEDTTFKDISAAMDGFTFTESTIKFGENVIVDLSAG